MAITSEEYVQRLERIEEDVKQMHRDRHNHFEKVSNIVDEMRIEAHDQKVDLDKLAATVCKLCEAIKGSDLMGDGIGKRLRRCEDLTQELRDWKRDSKYFLIGIGLCAGAGGNGILELIKALL